MQKNFYFKNYFFVGILKVNDDPDPHQNVMDPQFCIQKICTRCKECISSLWYRAHHLIS
jgi:hypothetical protein